MRSKSRTYKNKYSDAGYFDSTSRRWQRDITRATMYPTEISAHDTMHGINHNSWTGHILVVVKSIDYTVRQLVKI